MTAAKREESGSDESRPPSHAPAIRPAPIDPARYPRFYTRGHKSPRAIAWFGLRSFSGHLRHLISSAIASENIDSRDWMHADPPERLGEQIVRLLGRPDPDEDEDEEPRTSKSPPATSVTQGLGRDLWIDFIADTGDDSSVAE